MKISDVKIFILFGIFSNLTFYTYSQSKVNIIYGCYIGLDRSINKDSIINNSGVKIEDDNTKQALISLIPSNFLVMEVYVTINENTIKIIRKNNAHVASSTQAFSDSILYMNGHWVSCTNGISKPILKWKGTLEQHNDTKYIDGYKCKKSTWVFSDTGATFEIWSSPELPNSYNPFATSDLKLNGGVVEAQQLDKNFTYKLKAISKY